MCMLESVKRRIAAKGAYWRRQLDQRHATRRNTPEKRARWNRRSNTRYKTNVQTRLAHYLRSRIKKAVKRDQRAGSAVRDLGCSIDAFKSYLEALFSSRMSWDNYGEWHLDHIRPLAAFDLTDRAQFLVACHYTNYQPLWAADNLSKGARSPATG